MKSVARDLTKTQKIQVPEKDSCMLPGSDSENQQANKLEADPNPEPKNQSRQAPFLQGSWPRPLPVVTAALAGFALTAGCLFLAHRSLLEDIAKLAENDAQSAQQILKHQTMRRDLMQRHQRQHELLDKYRSQTQKDEQEIQRLRQSMALLSSNALAQEKLQDLSVQNQAATSKMDEVVAASRETLAKTRKQMEILEDANQRLQDEVDRLRLLQAETSQQAAPIRSGDREVARMYWTDWVNAEDANSFLRESVSKKARLPLMVEGKLAKSGSMFRFFVIPNLYQIRWQTEWGLTDDALIKRITYFGGKKYYELSRQTFMLNDSAPRHQVIFIHQMDMDEAKRLKAKYFVAGEK